MFIKKSKIEKAKEAVKYYKDNYEGKYVGLDDIGKWITISSADQGSLASVGVIHFDADKLEKQLSLGEEPEELGLCCINVLQTYGTHATRYEVFYVVRDFSNIICNFYNPYVPDNYFERQRCYLYNDKPYTLPTKNQPLVDFHFVSDDMVKYLMPKIKEGIKEHDEEVNELHRYSAGVFHELANGKSAEEAILHPSMDFHSESSASEDTPESESESDSGDLVLTPEERKLIIDNRKKKEEECKAGVRDIDKAADYFMTHYAGKYILKVRTTDYHDTGVDAHYVCVSRIDVDVEELKKVLKAGNTTVKSCSGKAPIKIVYSYPDRMVKSLDYGNCLDYYLLYDFYNPYINKSYYKHVDEREKNFSSFNFPTEKKPMHYMRVIPEETYNQIKEMIYQFETVQAEVDKFNRDMDAVLSDE